MVMPPPGAIIALLGTIVAAGGLALLWVAYQQTPTTSRGPAADAIGRSAPEVRPDEAHLQTGGRNPSLEPPRKVHAMSTDSDVTADLLKTLEDGKEGYEKGAVKLSDSQRPDLAEVFRGYSEQRASFTVELQQIAAAYGDELRESGSVAGAVHRGWMTLKDALAGSDPDGVLDTAEQGEDHAVKAYDKALAEDISPSLRLVVERQSHAVRAAHDHVRSLREAASS
jgi:uncharacterized protein (TIGR02284 family)